jgi:uncharacterized protein (DUF1501 family)
VTFVISDSRQTNGSRKTPGQADECDCPDDRAGYMSRRGLLVRSLAAAAGGALAGLVGDGLATQLAFATTPVTGDVLVVLSLRGGFDGLSAVVPSGDPAYYTARPSLAVPKAQLLGGDAMFGLHPALAPLLPMWTAGTLAAVHAVGQPDPTRSHFKAMEQMERAAAGTSIRTGWLDRMLGTMPAVSALSGVSIGSDLLPASLAGPVPNLGMSSIDYFKLTGDSSRLPMTPALNALYADAPAVLAAPAQSVSSSLATVQAVSSQAYTPGGGAVYPDTDLGRALRDVARLIRAQIGLAVACVDFGDWDMHRGLGTPIPGQLMFNHLRDLAQALAAFATDLGPTGLAGVTLVTLSEFGRRVAENGSRGTDHGHGNAMFVLGGGVYGGRVHGTWPGLAPSQLVAGDLAATTDYRSVIGEILQKRCGVGSLSTVFPGFTPRAVGVAKTKV